MCCVRQRTGDSPDCWRLSGWLGLSPSAACRSIILPRQVSISCISKLKNNGIRVLHMSIVHSARMPQGVPSAIWRSHELRGWPVCRRQPASWTHRDWVDVTDLCRLCDLTMMMMSFVAGADLSLSRLQVTSHKPGDRLPLLPTRLPSQLQNITALWPVPNYTAWWQKHVMWTRCSVLLHESGTARSWTHSQLRVQYSNHYIAEYEVRSVK